MPGSVLDEYAVDSLFRNEWKFSAVHSIHTAVVDILVSLCCAVMRLVYR